MSLENMIDLSDLSSGNEADDNVEFTALRIS